MPQSHGSAPIAPNQSHHAGFDKALQDALDRMSPPTWSQGPHTVEVTFQLDVEVKSPGKVGFYRVTLNG